MKLSVTGAEQKKNTPVGNMPSYNTDEQRGKCIVLISLGKIYSIDFLKTKFYALYGIKKYIAYVKKVQWEFKKDEKQVSLKLFFPY